MSQDATNPRVLVVEDEEKLALSLQAGLQAEQYSVRISYTGEDGFYLAESQPFDLLILDIMLPGRNGIEIVGTLRKQGNKMPVLLLSARHAIQDRVLGLDTGADDYLVKPFALPELLARVRALLRRGQEVVSQNLALEDLEMNMAERSVTRTGRHLDLTTREYDLLRYLLIHKCRVVSREMLAREVWKETGRHTPIDNVIDVQIVRLRRKLDEPFVPKLLHTVRGVGFVLRKDT
jgi:two-component system, OmpR family, copper resistance phosphate regulon response regulator CusR